MIGYSVSTQVGRVAGSEFDELFTPRTPRLGRVPVVLCHGYGNPLEYVDTALQPSSVRLAAALASAGIPCIAGDFGGNTWGNDTAMSRIDAARAVLASSFPQSRTDKVALVGVSMGGGVAVRYSQLHPTQVAAVVGLIPLVDLVGVYTANTGGYQASIATAWNVTAPAALPASADTYGNASAAKVVPFLAGYSTVDTIVDPAKVRGYATAVGGTAIITDRTAGHSDAAVGGMPVSTVGRFLAANGC